MPKKQNTAQKKARALVNATEIPYSVAMRLVTSDVSTDVRNQETEEIRVTVTSVRAVSVSPFNTLVGKASAFESIVKSSKALDGVMAPRLRALKQIDGLMASQRQSLKALDGLVGKTSAFNSILKSINRWT